ncbi:MULTISPECIES: efflux transporter outer membrane subunit [unclassified Achromobacter]|uniref:efflux transporter outer membrane subunit n=1 Tax=unclassified Achromobacter TaxID=2626865 RepID=UPI000B518467|nr:MULTISPECIES: efflux transporter outer membrane subunit [unclassified Achromobacter]OWT76934.1 RND transporter [Achromobacter sp. HZ28]OWT77814.1 RND transporter [Achromobacter sp. HZ34]
MKMNTTRLTASLTLPLLLLLQACAVGPDYHRPEAAAPTTFKEAPTAPAGWKLADPGAAARGAWWEVYQDPVLNGLAAQVTVGNQNLKAYEAAYRQALAVVREARANLAPTVTAGPSLSRARSNGNSATTRSVEIDASWDLDLWGKVRRQVESDQASAQASAAELADLTLSAQAELVTDYFGLRYQDALGALLRDTVRAYERSLSIAQNQYSAGVAARSDVITAQTQLASARASAIASEQLRDQYEHAIALLIGKAPADVTIMAGELPTLIPAIPAGLPSDLLERRPDIAQAERTMQQQNALIGVAEAAWYPSVTLSAAAGYSGASPLFSAANALWSLLASGSQTLFDGGARSATTDAAKAAYDQSVANYRQTVLAAFQDVEDELSNLRVLSHQATAQDEALTLARQAATIALNEYRAGTQSYTTVVTAQATALSNEETALQIQQGRLAASAALIKALGGGWRSEALQARFKSPT